MSEITRTLRGHKNDTWTRDGVLYRLALENRFGQHYFHWWERPPFGRDAPMDCSLRFNWFTVPAGAVINQAYIEISARKDDDHTNCHVKIRAELAPDPTQIESVDDFNSRPRTAASVLWHNVPAFKKNNVYRTPDLSALIHELVESFPETRKNINIFLENDGSDRDSHREFNHYAGWPKEAPTLFIKYNSDDPPIWVPPSLRCTIADQSGCWERWGAALTDNNPWTLTYAAADYTITLEDGKMAFSIPYDPWNAISVRHSPGRWPLINAKGQHLWFNARAISAEGDDEHHWTTYLLFTRKDGNERVIEPVIHRGSDFGPIPMTPMYDWLRVVWDYGLGPQPFDVYAEWHEGQKRAAQSTDPTGWEVWMTRIALERAVEAGYQSVVSDFMHLYYDQEPLPTPPSPTKNWLITDMNHAWHLEDKQICVQTDVLCHLYLRFKDEPPEWHARLTSRRGVPITNDPGLAMQEYDQVEQEQPGDTLCHLFILAPFPAKTRIWYYFMGTIDGGDVKSRSQFFKQEYEMHYLTDLFSEAWGCEITPQPVYAQLFYEGWTS